MHQNKTSVPFWCILFLTIINYTVQRMMSYRKRYIPFKVSLQLFHAIKFVPDLFNPIEFPLPQKNRYGCQPRDRWQPAILCLSVRRRRYWLLLSLAHFICCTGTGTKLQRLFCGFWKSRQWKFLLSITEESYRVYNRI